MSEQAFQKKESLHGLRRAQILTPRFLAPFIGMTMFWPLLRYESFVRVALPPSQHVSILGMTVTAHIAFLCVLAVFAALAFVFAKRLELFVRTHRIAVTALMASGSAGTALSLLVQSGSLPYGWLVLSAALIALGFLFAYVSWALFFCNGFCTSDLIVLVASFFASFVCFSYGVPLGSLLGPANACLIMPAGTGLSWLVSTSSRNAPADKTDPQSSFLGVHPIGTPAIVIALSLLVGASVRGISYLYAPASDIRLEVSLLLCGTWLVATMAFCRRARATMGSSANDVPHAISRFTLVCWSAISLVLLTGLFLFLCAGMLQLGGDVVIASRTAMGVVFWMVLCNSLANIRGRTALRTFVAYGLTTELVSWLLSYAVIPAVLQSSGTEFLSPGALVLATIFGLMALMLTAFMVKTALSKQWEPGSPSASSEEAAGVQHDGAADSVITAPKCLTEREAAVVCRYARGNSLGKVADELGISKSTAQSHIKNAYRKLGVHSRDQLIERLGR